MPRHLAVWFLLKADFDLLRNVLSTNRTIGIILCLYVQLNSIVFFAEAKVIRLELWYFSRELMGVRSPKRQREGESGMV